MAGIDDAAATADAYFAAEQRARLRGQRLDAAKAIDPWRQGELDGLCGLYTALNALRLVGEGRGVSLAETQCLALFRHGASFLDTHGKLSAAVRYGLRWRLWVKLVAELAAKASRLLGGPVPLHQPFAGLDDVTELLFVATVRAVIRDRQAVLILLKGTYEHYSVVSGLTATRLQLFDSYGYRWITLAACATAGEAGARRHRIHIPSLLVMGS